MPSARHNGVFALRTIYCKEVERLVVGIVQTYRYNNMAKAQIGCSRKSLLNPELLKFYLTTLLCLLFPFATFLVFFLISKACTSMLELNLCAKRPALAKVVAQVYHSMRNIESTMARIVLMFLGLTISTNMITKKIA